MESNWWEDDINVCSQTHIGGHRDGAMIGLTSWKLQLREFAARMAREEQVDDTPTKQVAETPTETIQSDSCLSSSSATTTQVSTPVNLKRKRYKVVIDVCDAEDEAATPLKVRVCQQAD